MRVLFASTKGAGHLGPLVPLARACVAAGHEVLVAAPPSLEAAVRAARLAFHALPEPPADELRALWARIPTLGRDEANRVVMGEIFGRMNAAATLPAHRALCRDWRPDVIVREGSEFGSALAAEAEGIAHARVGFGLARTEDTGVALAAPRLETVRATAGLAPDPAGERLRAAPYLTWFPRSLEAPEHPAPEGAAMTLRLHDDAWDLHAVTPLPATWWAGADADAPLAVVLADLLNS